MITFQGEILTNEIITTMAAFLKKNSKKLLLSDKMLAIDLYLLEQAKTN